MSHKYIIISTTIQIFLITVFMANSIFIETVNTNMPYTTEFYEYKYRLFDHPDTYTIVDYDGDGEDEVVVFHIKPGGYLIRGGISIIGSRGEETVKYYRYFIPYYIMRYNKQLLLIGYFTNISSYVVAFTDQALNIKDYILLNVSKEILYPPLMVDIDHIGDKYILPILVISFNKTSIVSKLVSVDLSTNRSINIASMANVTIKYARVIDDHHIVWGPILIDLKLFKSINLFKSNNIDIEPSIVYDTAVYRDNIYIVFMDRENDTFISVFHRNNYTLHLFRKIFSNTSILKTGFYVFNNSLYLYTIVEYSDKYSIALYKVIDDLRLRKLFSYRDLVRVSNPVFKDSKVYLSFELNETVYSETCIYYSVDYLFRIVEYNLLNNETTDKQVIFSIEGRWICNMVWAVSSIKPRNYINLVIVDNSKTLTVLLMGRGYIYIVSNHRIGVLIEPFYISPLLLLLIMIIVLMLRRKTASK